MFMRPTDPSSQGGRVSPIVLGMAKIEAARLLNELFGPFEELLEVVDSQQ